MKNVSRRNFVASAGLVAGAAAVATAGVALADEAATEEASAEEASTSGNAVSAWGVEYPWPAEPPAIADDQIEEELSVDVAVVGLGVAGVAAFRAAAEAGAVVAGFEKAAQPSVRSMQYCYINGAHYAELGMEEVDEDTIILGEWNESAQVASYPIIREFVRHEGEVFDWWCAGDDNLTIGGLGGPGTDMDLDAEGEDEAAEGEAAPAEGEGAPEGEGEGSGSIEDMMNGDTTTLMTSVDPSVDWANEAQASYPTRVFFIGHQHLVDCNLQKGVDAGGTAYFGHFVEQVIMEDGRAAGVYVRNAETGMYKKVHAAKGVVFACGGCASNKDMVRVFYPAMAENGNLVAWPNLDVEGTPTNTGDGYRMGYWAGAAFSQNMCAMTHVMGGANDVANMDASSGLSSPNLRLNYNGERFMNEDASVSDWELALDRQPKRKAFTIFDANLDTQMADAVVEQTMTLAQVEEKVDGESYFKADTIEELLDAIVAYDADFDKETALASIERYNELCASGVDEDFGKKEKYLWPVQDGPFYAQRFGIGLALTTMGGLASDEYAHVISTERQVIPGLYAAGNIQGDRFAVKYPFKLSGASHSMAMYYGYVAGQNCANGI